MGADGPGSGGETAPDASDADGSVDAAEVGESNGETVVERATAGSGEPTDEAGGATTDGTAADVDHGAGVEGLVSVVLPTYGRRPDFFREAVDGVAAQTYDPVELVVVDDSPGGVARAVGEDPPGDLTVRVVRDGDHDGPGEARNAGIRAARGEFLAFVDDDDRWLARKLERQVATLRAAGPDAGVVYTGYRFVAGDEVLSTYVPTTGGDVTRSLLAGRGSPIFSALLVRAAVVPAAGLVDPRFPYLEDREWCLRLSRHCEFRTISVPLVEYRKGDHEQLTDDYEALRDVAYPLFLEKHRRTAAACGAVWERKLVAALSRTVASGALGAGRYGEAVRFTLRALRHDPARPEAYAFLLAAAGGPVSHRPLRALRRAATRLHGRGSEALRGRTSGGVGGATDAGEGTTDAGEGTTDAGGGTTDAGGGSSPANRRPPRGR